MEDGAADPLAELITSYNELNSSFVEELTEEPSPLDFMRYVARNTPFVIRRGASHWQAATKWNADFLRELLKDETVNVAVTPKGNADSPTRLENGSLVFAKPWEEDQAFPEFLDYVIRQERDPSFPADAEVRYAQTQNDNLRHEYISLFSHVQRDIPFARIALQNNPDAINLWIGNSRSTTALHKDNYENIYVQLLGAKHFVLLPPHCHPCVNEQLLPPAHYARDPDGPSSLALVLDDDDDGRTGAGGQGLDEPGGEDVPFATWDPDRPGECATAYSALARPVRVTLRPGDMLYLPAMWYHKVSQSCSEDGICVAVNYWYDMEFSGPLYPLCSFVRSVTQQQQRQQPVGEETGGTS
ncbi:JmjC domain-containing protein 7 [Pleurostoma richardsiae]|uniref:JmjC domain-containing protein 7 n=1 Tax=Pleurostoma richardsiae TaxID=41990 RepID=A0AA38RXC7_9PEZI|nr:JmjC domain-containing protein 7 [Pleurostoma richardsiae]